MPIAEKARIVVDTNVLISAALLPHSTAARALDRALKEFQLIQSSTIQGELIEVISRGKFGRYLDEENRSHFLFVVAQFAEVIEVRSRITECSDPKDNKFLELAIDGKAELIVSGDRHLQDLHPFRGIDIVSPGDFLDCAPGKP